MKYLVIKIGLNGTKITILYIRIHPATDEKGNDQSTQNKDKGVQKFYFMLALHSYM